MKISYLSNFHISFFSSSRKLALPVFFTLCYALQVFGQMEDWEFINPAPTNQNLDEVVFVDDNRGFIANENIVYVTADGGETWVEVENLSGAVYMKFLNEFGIALNSTWSGEEVYRSLDAGETWTELNISIEGDLRRVQFLDETTLIITTSQEIAASGNAGDSWFITELPSTFVVDGFFQSDGSGVIATSNGEIYSTDDSGVNWQLRYEIDSFSWSEFFTVEFLNETVGFATSENSDAKLLRTTDGGITWEQIAPEIFSEIYEIEFINETIGYMAGEYGKVFKTTDSGNTWEEKTPDEFVFNTSSNIEAIYVHDEDEIITVGRMGRISRSEDGGANWSFNSNLYKDITDLCFIDEELVYALTNNSLYKSMDGGLSWDYHSELPDNNYGTPKQIIFKDENIGFLTRYSQYFGYYYKTVDGGITWTELPDPNSFLETVSFIGFFDPDTLFTSTSYLSSSNPASAFATYRVTDDGNDWELIYPNTIYSMSIISSQHLYGLEYDSGDRRILRTSDGGDSWQTVLEVQDTTLRKLSFPSPEVGYCLASEDFYEGGLYKTINGGEDWNYTDFPSEYFGEDFVDILFVTELHGFLLEEDGRVVYTSDGGANWSDLGWFWGAEKIDFYGDYLYLYGDDGNIIRRILPQVLNTTENMVPRLHWTIYPNPTDENLNFDLSAFQELPSSYSIRDLTGTLLMEGKLDKSAGRLNVSQLNSGILILELHFKSGTLKQRFVKFRQSN